ncbi:MAG: hypothetical protein QY332_10525 [Anaerolineales bacterium]|nr:MAG: hypothetical protein QY332_10525 [Anaerolineales bacterium]
MKHLLLSSTIALTLLSACGPTQALPTSTPMATATAVPISTFAPTLEPWMVSLPEDVVSVQVEGDMIFGLDDQGKQIMRFNEVSGEWDLVEKVYTSCLNPELQAEVDDDFEDLTKVTVGEAFAKFENRPGFTPTVSFRSETGLFRSYMMYVGVETLSVAHLTGNEADFAVCGFFVQSAYPDTRVPIVLGLQYNGNYESMIATVDYTSGQPGEQGYFKSREELLKYLENKIPLGAELVVDTQSFVNAVDVDTINPQQVQMVNLPGLYNFWKLTKSDYLEKMRGIRNPQDVLKKLDPTVDVGMYGYSLYFVDTAWMMSE